MEKTRSEHITWCKERALRELDAGSCENAVASMLSDLGKHKETETLALNIGMLGMLEIQRGPMAVRKFIEGFN